MAEIDPSSVTSHVHDWKLATSADGSVLVIDTYPEEYPYVCGCGAFTHHPETGEPCPICAPEDYSRRGPTVRLSGGPFDGKLITTPANKTVYLRCDNDAVQKVVMYERTDDASVWKFRWNIWTHPFKERD